MLEQARKALCMYTCIASACLYADPIGDKAHSAACPRRHLCARLKYRAERYAQLEHGSAERGWQLVANTHWAVVEVVGSTTL